MPTGTSPSARKPTVAGQRVLVVEDDAAMRELLDETLSARGIRGVHRGGRGLGAAQARRPQSVHAVVTDLNLGGVNGIELCQRVHALDATLPVVLITAFGSLDAAVGAVRAGAYDFITKPFKMEQLVLALRRAANLRDIQSELSALRASVARASAFGTLVGESEPMRKLRATLDRVARSDAAVLILGESGTGKELIAKSIHANSDRQKGPFVAVNMSAIPATLIESELFGHARGAFTSAHATSTTGSSFRPMAGRSFWTRWASCPSSSSPSCCARSSRAPCVRWAASTTCASTSASSRPPTGISRRVWRTVPSARTSTSA
jgi:DNA-binding NtrC family response regulator